VPVNAAEKLIVNPVVVMPVTHGGEVLVALAVNVTAVGAVGKVTPNATA